MKKVRFFYKDLDTGKITRSEWIDSPLLTNDHGSYGSKSWGEMSSFEKDKFVESWLDGIIETGYEEE